MRPSLYGLRQGARRARGRATRRRDVEAYLGAHSTRKLQLGCGPSLLDGWLNTDLAPPRGAVYVDATRRLPFPDGLFDYVFSEHFIEHLPYESGCSMLRECLRVLRPGGRVRVATPDMRRAVSLVEPGELGERYVRWSVEHFAPFADKPRPSFAINQLFRGFGHQFLYDRETLQAALERAGFTDVGPCEPGASDDPELAGLEGRGREPADVEMVNFETLVLEGGRPR